MRAYVVSQFGEEVEEVDPSSLVGQEVRVIGGDDDSVPTLPVVAGPQRSGGAIGMLGAMLGRRQSRD